MKPKDYLRAFNLLTEDADVQGAVNQLRLDFLAQVEFYTERKTLNLTMFDNIKKQIQDKHDSLVRSGVAFAPDTWTNFAQWIIEPLRVKSFPEHYAKLREAEARQRRISAMRARESQRAYEQMRAWMHMLLMQAARNDQHGRIASARESLGIPADTKLTQDTIIAAFRAKAKSVHTDKGGSGDVVVFQQILEARETLLSALGPREEVVC